MVWPIFHSFIAVRVSPARSLRTAFPLWRYGQIVICQQPGDQVINGPHGPVRREDQQIARKEIALTDVSAGKLAPHGLQLACGHPPLSSGDDDERLPAMGRGHYCQIGVAVAWVMPLFDLDQKPNCGTVKDQSPMLAAGEFLPEDRAGLGPINRADRPPGL
jgi:hypothetical protein